MMSYAQRAEFCQNKLSKKLLQLMQAKKTNLSLSADVTRAEELLKLVDQCGPDICLLKTHIDIIQDFTPALTQTLKKLAQQHQFLIFEDRKFADIGHTVKEQYAGGIYHIADWADLINAHTLPGPGIISGLAEIGLPKERGLLLLAEMSSEGHLLDNVYQQKTLTMAEQFPEFVIGFITQRKLSDNPAWIYLTPGVQLNRSGDSLGQQYITPEKALIEQQSDIIIVGRGITHAKDPLAAAKHYREAGWQAYSRRA